MHFLHKSVLILTISTIFSSCAPYKISTQTVIESLNGPVQCHQYKNEVFEEECLLCLNKVTAQNHWLYHYIPRHRCQLYWFDLGHWCTWMLFGNDDDGIFGEEITAKYRLEYPVNTSKAILWGCRNPLHNFCFYVIGTAHCENSELTLLKLTQRQASIFQYKNKGDTTFASDYTSLYIALHGWKPFVSLRLAYTPLYKSDFYFGWRCRGNFGIKCIVLHKRKKPLELE